MSTPTPEPLILPDTEAAIIERWDSIHAGAIEPTVAEQCLIDAFEARQYQSEATDETPWDFGLRALGALAPTVDDDLDHGSLGRFHRTAQQAWRIALAHVGYRMDADALARWGFQAGQAFESKTEDLCLTVMAVHGPDSLEIQGPADALVAPITQQLSARSLELRLLSAGFTPPFAPKGNPQVWVPPTTSYLFHRWSAIEAGRAAPRVDEQRVMDAVAAGLDADIHFQRDLVEYVVEALGSCAPPPEEQHKPDPTKPVAVRGGIFGMLVYYAQQEVRRRRAEARAEAALGRWGFAAGQKFKGINVQGTRYSSVTILSAESATQITLTLTKRGSSRRWRVTASADGLARILAEAGYSAPNVAA